MIERSARLKSLEFRVVRHSDPRDSYKTVEITPVGSAQAAAAADAASAVSPGLHIDAMSAPHTAAIQQQAKIAQAEADRASAEAQQKSAQAQAQYARQTAEVEAQQASLQAQAKAKADSEAAVAQANADAAAAEARQESQTRQANAQKETIEAQTRIAEQSAALREQQLQAEVIKPAEAEAEKVKIAANADAEATKVQAEAAASNNRVALDRMLIEQMPQIVREAAQGLSNAELTILNGSDGLSEVAAGLLSQGLRIYGIAREGLTLGQPETNGHGDSTKVPPAGQLPERR